MSGRRLYLLLALPMLAMTLGCAALPAGRGSDPAVLIIRNHSGQDIGTATVSAAVSSANAGRRHGSISPVPRGASQVFVRPASAPRLPALLNLTWDTASGVVTREVSLRRPLKERDEALNALVFEIRPDLAVDVYRESYSP